MIKRILMDKLREQCFKGKVILLVGARQVGKTTLLKDLVESINVDTAWFNADESDVLNEFAAANTSTRLLQVIGANTQLAIIDEAQQIPDIGSKLKLLYDTKPELQIIATGSSAFDLLNRTGEPLTGRKRTYHLYSISYKELVDDTNILEARRMLETRLIFGSYPEVVTHPGHEKEALLEIANSYLYKDILKLDGIRKAGQLEKLLQALSFQVGNEVNYHELSKTIGNIDSATVEKYLDLLEKTYVIYKLPALSRNMRNEIKKGKKYYFYDTGIRNVLISNYAPMEMRFDKGALWENFLLSERIKMNQYALSTPNTYFWRTHDQAEIDYIEEMDGTLNAFEIKWKESKVKFPKSFLEAYPNNRTQLINFENFEEFVGVSQ
ncbi:MAG: ATPase [Bacteroidetes bacterium CG18_big_fil_WC_8_21_14_2_50_41_14]|nr:MAG: ATPase [Bacteroidetes bacterium CG18_big_fil_WC_8_21_14_2_50_41_14]PJB59699.1 MAG: ATPase [Bacteroidetes bacterium CG_4_9_14_3_um_filter_41_19]